MVVKVNSIKPIENCESKVKNNLCLCKALKPTFVWLKIFGLFPITSTHSEEKEEEKRCEFKFSIPLLIYSLIICVLLSTEFLLTTEILNIFTIHKGKSLHAILNALSDILYSIFIVLLTFVNIIRSPKFIKCLNKMVSMKNDGLLCQSSLRGILKVQYVTILTFFLVLMIQYFVIFLLDSSEKYLTDFFDYKLCLNKLTTNLFFGLHVIFINLTSIIVAMSGCFLKILTSSLNFQPAHPLKDVDQSTNEAEYLGFYRYKICEEHHKAPIKIKGLTTSEIIEFLRCLHEDISLIGHDINDCLDPQFLLHVVLELSALILHWYAVILYLVYDFTSETTKTINILNILFVTIHTIGLLTFLKHAQQLQNMVKGLMDYLLEFSTRIVSPEEHQQIRIFIHKLKIHRPLTASGVFNIDLGIAGPVFANILTYVLVALQFDVPKN